MAGDLTYMAVSLDVYPGDSLPVSLELKDEDGDAFDLTSYTVEVKALWDVDGEEILSGDDLTVTDAAGTVVGTFSTAQTLNFPLGKKTKLFIVLTNGDTVSTLLMARVNVKELR